MLQKIRRVRQDDADRERHWFQLVADGLFAADSIAAEFDNRSASLDVRWRKFIGMKIGEAATRLSTPPNPS